MDFQLARNLSAIARAREEISQALLLHIDSTVDCLNREIIMSAASSEATEQLLTSARALLAQVQTRLVTQSDEGANRFRDAQIAFITERRERSSSTSAASHVSRAGSHQSSQQQSGGQSGITERVAPSEGHSYAHTAIRGGLRRDDNSSCA